VRVVNGVCGLQYGKHAMAVEVSVVREVVERVCTRKDVLDACKRRDLGAVITRDGGRADQE
jgi:hypothetical protein